MMLLVLRALGLGDFLTAVPALRALADVFPRHRLVLAMPDALAPLARLSGLVHEVIDAAPLAPLPRGARGADIAVNLHGRGPESHRVLLQTRPARLIAFHHPAIAETAHAPRWRADEHEVHRWCRLLAEHGIAADPDRLDLVAPGSPSLAAPSAACGTTLLHPGAASVARRWPAERWAAVARAEAAAGRRVIITAGAAEGALAYSIARAATLDGDAVHAGTDIVRLAALVHAAARIVCGDTGVAHLATALRTPSIVLFGPSSPAHWGPPPDRPWHRALWKGRLGDPHGHTVDPGLAAITVDDVLGALETIAAAPRPVTVQRATA
jgi:ADP-heptose:LPS heptosyltransferase